MKSATIALILAAVFGIGLTIGAVAAGSHYRAKITKMQHEQTERESAIAQAVIEQDNTEANKLQEALNHANEQTQAARADADAANAASKRLRDAIASYRARYPAGIASTGQGEPDTDPIGVLAELLGRMGEAGERISRYADEVKIAGLACEELHK